MKTSDLTGAALDWAVAKCEGKNHRYAHHLLSIEDLNLVSGVAHSMVQRYSPSCIWSQGGPIIDRERISWTGQSARIVRYQKGQYLNTEAFGPTPLIAAMRCYVASKLGDTVEVPNELI